MGKYDLFVDMTWKVEVKWKLYMCYDNVTAVTILTLRPDGLDDVCPPWSAHLWRAKRTLLTTVINLTCKMIYDYILDIKIITGWLN